MTDRLLGGRRGPFLAALLAALLASFFSPGRARGQSRVDGPRMEIDPEEFDFGHVQQNQELVHEFVVRNVGSEDLEVLKIATSCGCAAALVADRVIAPGGETILRVTLETRRYRGRKERTVSIASNDRRRVLQIHVQAFVETPDGQPPLD